MLFIVICFIYLGSILLFIWNKNLVDKAAAPLVYNLNAFYPSYME